jgi:hypothetical protein
MEERGAEVVVGSLDKKGYKYPSPLEISLLHTKFTLEIVVRVW